MKTNTAAKLALVTASLAMLSSPLAARKASDLRSLVGTRASAGERALEQRGFTYVTGHAGKHDVNHTYWWHGKDDNCIHVETYDGRYRSIEDASNSDCNHSGNGDAGIAIAAVAGVAILGAILASSHKKDHHDDNTHLSTQEDELQYERGFNDGLYNKSYHNSDKSDHYSRGYSSGVEQRNRDTSYHSDRGGYSAAYIGDLKGMDSIRAIDTMSSRGFKDVDSFSSGNTQYGVFYRAQSNQCVQLTFADRRVYDARDIHTHPKCR